MTDLTHVLLPLLHALPRAIAVDLDGTLLDSRTRLSERNRKALEDCITAGLPVIIATARATRTVNRILPPEVRNACSVVIMNGAIATGRPPLSGQFREALPEDVCGRIIEVATTHDQPVRITIEIDGWEFGANWTADAATLWERNRATPDMLIPIEEAVVRQPTKLALSCPDGDNRGLADRLRKSLGETVSVVPSIYGRPLLNVTSPRASKPIALGRLLSPAGISLQDLIAFGDDVPDIDMLQQCGMSVAMENGLPEVKVVCQYCTASNDEDGVAIVLEKVLAAMRERNRDSGPKAAP